MKRTWTSASCKHTATPDKKVLLARMFDSLEWHEVSDGGVMGMKKANGVTVSAAMNVAIHELKIPRVSHVTTSNEMAPYGLLAIRGHFTNGWADIYLCDEGHQLVVLATDFHPKDYEALVEGIGNHNLN